MLRRSALIATCALSFASAPALADALQQQVLAGTRAVGDEDFAFTQTTVAQRSGEAAKEFVLRYDPRRPKGMRWTLLKSEGRVPTAKEAASAAKQSSAAPVPSYARIGRWFGAPATRVAVAKDSVTYRFSKLPKDIIKIGSHDASADTVAEAVVNTSGTTPFVERVRFTSATPFRMALVAKIERFTFTSTNRLLPDGRAVLVDGNADMFGSLLGKAGSFKTRTSYSDLRAVR